MFFQENIQKSDLPNVISVVDLAHKEGLYEKVQEWIEWGMTDQALNLNDTLVSKLNLPEREEKFWAFETNTDVVCAIWENNGALRFGMDQGKATNQEMSQTLDEFKDFLKSVNRKKKLAR